MHLFRQTGETHVVSIAGNGSFEYTITVDGSIARMTSNGHLSSESSDQMTTNQDGTVTVMGNDGDSTMGDSWEISGNVLDFQVTPVDGDPTVFLDGLSTTADDVVNRIGDSPGDPIETPTVSAGETIALILAGAVVVRVLLG